MTFSYATLAQLGQEQLDWQAKNEQYWGKLEEDDFETLTTKRKPRQRCPWCHCYRHTPICKEVHDADEEVIEMVAPGQNLRSKNPRMLRIKVIGWAMKMPFTQHKGKKVSEVPPDFLKWLYTMKIARNDLKDEIERVLEDTEFRIEPWEKAEADEFIE